MLAILCMGLLSGCEIRGATDHLISGNEAFQRNDYKTAEIEYRAALKQEPNSSTPLNNLGVVLNELGKYPDAIEILSRAVSADPKNSIAHYTLSKALLKTDQYDRAIQEAQTAIALAPDTMGAHRALAEAALLKAKKENGGTNANSDAAKTAIDEFRVLLQADSDDDSAHQNLGDALWLQGDKAQAVAEEKKAVDLNPDNMDARKLLARMLNDQGDSKGAVELLDAVIKKDSGDEEARKMRLEFSGAKGDAKT